MAAREWASLLAGLVLAATGVTTLALAGHRRDTAVPASPAPAAATTLPEGGGPVPSTVPAASGIPASVAAMLARDGSLDAIVPGSGGIPAEVARVLAERGVILTVPAPPPEAALLGSGR